MSACVNLRAEQPKVLFFDAGGTLLRPRYPVGETYAALARTHGAELDAVLLEQNFRRAFKSLKKRDSGTIPDNGEDPDWWRAVVHRSLEGLPLSADFPFTNYFADLYESFAKPELWELYPEVKSALEFLHQRGFPMAIISNWDRRLRPVLEGHFIAPFFQGFFISAEMGVVKPDPNIYRLALEKMHCSASEAMMIGDDPVNDDEAVRRLGWQSFLLDRPSRTLTHLLEVLIG